MPSGIVRFLILISQKPASKLQEYHTIHQKINWKNKDIWINAKKKNYALTIPALKNLLQTLCQEAYLLNRNPSKEKDPGDIWIMVIHITELDMQLPIKMDSNVLSGHPPHSSVWLRHHAARV